MSPQNLIKNEEIWRSGREYITAQRKLQSEYITALRKPTKWIHNCPKKTTKWIHNCPKWIDLYCICNIHCLVSAPPKIYDTPARYIEGLQFCRNDTIHARILFVARPAPTATWTCNDKPIKSSKRLEMKTTKKHSIITISDCVRSDSGVYKLTVENKLGSDSVEVPIAVVGK